jgi:hypothetical protein
MQGKNYNMKNKRVKIRLSVLVFAITTFIIAIANPAIALNSQQYGIDSSFLAELQSKEMPDYDRPEAIEKGLVVENGHVARLYKKESDLRTVIFANKDGTETAYIFDEPVKYIDENGKIVDKSNRLYSVYADEYAYVNKDNDIRTYFPKTLDEKSGIKLEYGDISIEMYPYSGKSTSVEKRTESDEKDYVYYDGVFGNDTSVRYTPTFSGFKEDIILYKNTGNHFNFIIKCGALKMIEENNIVHFIDPQSGEIVATLGEVYMYDSFVGESKDFSHGTWDVATELKHLENGDYLATIIVDEEFLSRPETVYPVYVDPTVTINATGSGSSKTILDTPIYNGSDVTNITAGANTSAVIGYVGTLNGVQYGSGRLLMRFPGLMNQSFMSDYNYTITAATLYMKEASGLSTSASIAAHIYYEALKNKKYSCFIQKGTFMDMMYMPDALRAIIDLIEANPDKLKHRNAFNVSAMSFDPEMLASSIRKYIPEFELDYDVDPIRQCIAESWPNSLDDSAAREEWGWNPKYDLDSMTKDMLEKLRIKLNIQD